MQRSVRQLSYLSLKEMVENLKTGEMASNLQRRRIRHAEVLLTRSRRQKGPAKAYLKGGPSGDFRKPAFQEGLRVRRE